MLVPKERLLMLAALPPGCPDDGSEDWQWLHRHMYVDGAGRITAHGRHLLAIWIAVDIGLRFDEAGS